MNSALGLRGMLRDTCTVRPFVSEDDYSVPVFGTGVQKKCRFAGKPEESVKDENGRDVDADVAFHFLGDETIDVKDELEFAGEKYEIVRILRPRNLRNVNHISVFANRK